MLSYSSVALDTPLYHSIPPTPVRQSVLSVYHLPYYIFPPPSTTGMVATCRLLGQSLDVLVPVPLAISFFFYLLSVYIII